MQRLMTSKMSVHGLYKNHTSYCTSTLPDSPAFQCNSEQVRRAPQKIRIKS